MVKKSAFQVFAFMVVSCSIFLSYAGFAHAEGLPFVASEHIFDRVAPMANSASLLALAPTTWESALFWIFGSLLVLAAVFLILWALAASSASLLSDLPSSEKSIAEERVYHRYNAGGVKKPARPASPAFPEAMHALPGGVLLFLCLQVSCHQGRIIFRTLQDDRRCPIYTYLVCRSCSVQ